MAASGCILDDKVIVTNGIAHVPPGSRAIEPSGRNDGADASRSVDHRKKLQPARRIDPAFYPVAQRKMPSAGRCAFLAAKANFYDAYPFPEGENRTVGQFVAGLTRVGHRR